MDTDIFLARCEALDDGLHDLVNDCYDSLTDVASAEERNRLINLAMEKINLYNELSEDFVNERHKEEIQNFNRYINQLKKFVEED